MSGYKICNEKQVGEITQVLDRMTGQSAGDQGTAEERLARVLDSGSTTVKLQLRELPGDEGVRAKYQMKHSRGDGSPETSIQGKCLLDPAQRDALMTKYENVMEPIVADAKEAAKEVGVEVGQAVGELGDALREMGAELKKFGSDLQRELGKIE